MSRAKGKVVSEGDRDLGWRADEDLLNAEAKRGFHPVEFEVTERGLDITFERTEIGGTSMTGTEYKSVQELHVPQLASVVEKFFASDDRPGFEPVFVYRVGLGGADIDGPYVRFIGRSSRCRWQLVSRLFWNEPWSDGPVSPGPEWRHIGSVPVKPGWELDLTHLMSEAFYVKPLDSGDEELPQPVVIVQPANYPPRPSSSVSPRDSRRSRARVVVRPVLLVAAGSVLTWLLSGR